MEHVIQAQVACESRIKRKLDAGKRVILAELDPPCDARCDAFFAGAQALVQAGADAITLADCPMARPRLDASLMACRLRREYGIETLPHMACRDRNANAAKALLLGLSMEGVHNVLAVTGDPVLHTGEAQVKGVFQFNSRTLARFVQALNDSGDVQPFFLCGALNVNAVNFEAELARTLDKQKCGVQAFLTQPVLSAQAACNMERAREALSARLIGGLFPPVSEKNARFLQEKVAGMAVDDAVIRAYAGLGREAGEALAVELCARAAQRIAPVVDGFYIVTPFMRVTLVARVIEAIKGL